VLGSLEILGRDIMHFWKIWPRVLWSFYFMFYPRREATCVGKFRPHVRVFGQVIGLYD
jgi:hypothetical protein